MSNKNILIYSVVMTFGLLLGCLFGIVIFQVVRYNIAPLPPVQLYIDTYGDSITDMGAYGTVTRFHDEHVENNNYQTYLYPYLRVRGIESSIMNYGIGGQVSKEITDRLVSATIIAPVVVAIMGTNDVFYALSKNSNKTYIVDQYKRMLEKNAFFFVCSVPPFGKNNLGISVNQANTMVNEINLNLRAFTEMHPNNTMFCDIHEHLKNVWELVTADGVHLKKQGNEIIGQAIGSCIVKHYYCYSEKK